MGDQRASFGNKGVNGFPGNIRATGAKLCLKMVERFAESPKIVHKALDFEGFGNLAWRRRAVNEWQKKSTTNRPGAGLSRGGMDAFFVPYIFPGESYFIGGLITLIMGLLIWRWSVSLKKKEAAGAKK